MIVSQHNEGKSECAHPLQGRRGVGRFVTRCRLVQNKRKWLFKPADNLQSRMSRFNIKDAWPSWYKTEIRCANGGRCERAIGAGGGIDDGKGISFRGKALL